MRADQGEEAGQARCTSRCGQACTRATRSGKAGGKENRGKRREPLCAMPCHGDGEIRDKTQSVQCDGTLCAQWRQALIWHFRRNDGAKRNPEPRYRLVRVAGPGGAMDNHRSIFGKITDKAKYIADI